MICSLVLHPFSFFLFPFPFSLLSFCPFPIPLLYFPVRLIDRTLVMASTHGSGAEDSPSKEQVKTDIITLTRFLTEEQAKHKEATGDFT